MGRGWRRNKEFRLEPVDDPDWMGTQRELMMQVIVVAPDDLVPEGQKELEKRGRESYIRRCVGDFEKILRATLAAGDVPLYWNAAIRKA